MSEETTKTETHNDQRGYKFTTRGTKNAKYKMTPDEYRVFCKDNFFSSVRCNMIVQKENGDIIDFDDWIENLEYPDEREIPITLFDLRPIVKRISELEKIKESIPTEVLEVEKKEKKLPYVLLTIAICVNMGIVFFMLARYFNHGC